MSLAALWLVVALLAGIVEVLSPFFGFIFVSLAALLTATAAALDLSLSLQLVLFSVTLLLSLVLLRPLLVSKLRARGVPSRTEALIGKRGQVTEAINPVVGTGRVIVGGDDWAARSGASIPLGAEVRVEGADGIILLVSPVESR